MLFYERKQKKPLKILVTEDQKDQEGVKHDEEKKEYYKLVDYKSLEGIKPNKIYKQVFEDNQKFEFENDIYSSEFYDFIKSTLQSADN